MWDALVEICISCGDRFVFYKKNGDVDQEEYYLFHKKDFAQPGSKMFDAVYGRQGRRSVADTKTLYAGIKSKDKIAEEWDETLKDSQREMRRMNEFGKPNMTSGA